MARDEDPADFDVDEDDADTDPCPHCGKAVYEGAERCPHCGQYITDEESAPVLPYLDRRNRPGRYPWWVIVGFVLAMLSLLTFIV